ncbi:hypothetical protein M758_UG067100 [Ceratodon purpureus]|nr:hypothetical protein M758_UG067100 [Ceratodon purpureus]
MRGNRMSSNLVRGGRGVRSLSAAEVIPRVVTLSWERSMPTVGSCGGTCGTEGLTQPACSLNVDRGVCAARGIEDRSFEVVAIEAETSVEHATPIGILFVKFCSTVFGVTGIVSPLA